MKCRVIVMAGGSGQRLWPMSTASLPKQFCNVASNTSMLQQTIDRFNFLPPSDISISSVKSYENILKKDFSKHPFILEPSTRDTAPAICLSALSVEADDDDILTFIPSDHYISKVDCFQKDIQKAISFFQNGGDGMLLIGIHPTYPADGYGYINGKVGSNGIGLVDLFREKPSVDVAKRYLEEGNYYWNSGIFFFKKSFIKKTFQTHSPQILQVIENYLKEKDAVKAKAIYDSVEKISFDFAIVEKIKGQIHFLINTFEWSDIGSWNSLNDLKADAVGNYSQGNVAGFKTQKTLCVNESPYLLVTNGVSNLNIIVSNNVIYIETKDGGIGIKEIIKQFPQ